MNPAQIHLMLNHVPLFASAAGCLLLAYALLRGNAAYQRLACVVLIAGAVAAPVVMLSGHGAEEKVEGLIGVAESRIHDHEEAGEAAAIGMVVLGLLAAAQLFLGAFPNAARWRRKGAYLVLLGAALAWGWTGWTAHLGGLIRHGAELGSPAPLGVPGGGAGPAGKD
jgi:uncharacterized membrane protein